MSRSFTNIPVWGVVTVFILMLGMGGLVFLWVTPHQLLSPKPVELPTLQTEHPVDENLFLLRTLANAYNTWLNTNLDADSQRAQINTIRSRFNRLRMHIEANPERLDPALLTAFGLFDAQMTAYEQLVQKIVLIDAGINAAASADRSASGSTALNTGVTAFDLSSRLTDTSGDAAALGLLAAGIHYALDDYSRSETRTKAQAAAHTAASTEYQRKSREGFDRVAFLAGELSTKYGWAPREAGFDYSDAEARQTQVTMGSDDLAAKILHYEARSRRHPRDPYLRSRLNELKAKDPGLKTREVAELALDTYAAQALIPAGALYDTYRHDLVSSAIYIAFAARLRQYDEGESVDRSTAESRIFLRLAEAYLTMMPDGMTGQARLNVAQAMLNDCQYREAEELFLSIEPILRDDSYYKLWRALSLSRNHEADEAMAWLRSALGSNHWSIHQIRLSPHLAWLKRKHPDEFQAIFQPQIKWSVNDDWLYDDITITNTSAFALTNLSFDFTLRSGSQSQTCKLALAWLAPGQSYTFVDAISGATGKWDMAASTYTWACDQGY